MENKFLDFLNIDQNAPFIFLIFLEHKYWPSHFKTTFGINFGPRVVPELEHAHFHFHA